MFMWSSEQRGGDNVGVKYLLRTADGKHRDFLDEDVRKSTIVVACEGAHVARTYEHIGKFLYDVLVL